VVREREHPYTRLLLNASPEPDPDVVKPPLKDSFDGEQKRYIAI